MARLSIVVPFYNTGKKIIDLINSLNEQLAGFDEKVEVLFISDGSTDDTDSIINSGLSLGNFRIYHKENGGVSSARNYGLDLAKGDYVIFIDSDDYLLPSATSVLLENIKADVGIDVFIFNYSEVRDGKVSHSVVERIHDSPTFFRRYISGEVLDFVSVTSCVFKKSFLAKNRLYFNEEYAYAEDQDFLVRALVRAKFKHFRDHVIGYNKDLSTAMNSVTLKRFDSIKVFLSWKKLRHVESPVVNKKITAELVKIGRIYYKNLSIEECVWFFNRNFGDKYRGHLSHNVESFLFFKFPLLYIYLYKLQRKLRKRCEIDRYTSSVNK